MRVGVITVGGVMVGVVNQVIDGEADDTFVPNLDGYEPMGRADAHSGSAAEGRHHDGGSRHSPHSHQRTGPAHSTSPPRHREPPEEHKHDSIRYGHHRKPSDGNSEVHQPSGKDYSSERGGPVHQGSAETDQAIRDAAHAHHLDVNTMRSIASVESSMNPSSNANRSTQYKGLYQIGRNEWARFGNGGNIYSAHDNAMGAARMFDANRSQFRKHFHRDPTDTELYMMHQQGLGFYTRGAMTNIGGNPYPGMHGPQTHESFEAGWGREVARRKAGFQATEPQAKASEPKKPVFNPDTDVI